MSYFTYIASDYPLPMVERPDREMIIEIDTETGLVFDGDFEDDFALYPAECLSDVRTEKKYAVYLEWSYYTEGRANIIIEYIKENLKHTDEVELWHIWSGAGEIFNVHSKKIPIASLTPEMIRELDEREIKIDMVEGCESADQYRYVVTKR
ncbi:MAG: hypothetical protein IJX95_06920 [Lachnospiraceae bacterium]|nr:hypothetical protein [Lachnospiraceae bacterium]